METVITVTWSLSSHTKRARCTVSWRSLNGNCYHGYMEPVQPYKESEMRRIMAITQFRNVAEVRPGASHYAHPPGGPGEPAGLNGVVPPSLAYTFTSGAEVPDGGGGTERRKKTEKGTASHPKHRNRVGVGGSAEG